MIKLFYFLSLLIAAAVPGFAQLIQGVEEHDSELAQGFHNFTEFIFVIVGLAVLIMQRPFPANMWSGLIGLLTGPLISVIFGIYMGLDWKMAILLFYLSEIVNFLSRLLFLYFIRRKYGLKTAGKGNVYFLTPLIFSVFFIGAYASINPDLFSRVFDVTDYVVIIFSVCISQIVYFVSDPFFNKGEKEMFKAANRSGTMVIFLLALAWFYAGKGLSDKEWAREHFRMEGGARL
jgi:hypothetical protein